jgi:hypothetical protein
MSLDLAKLRQKLEELKNPKLKTSKFDKKTWSPDKDKTKVVRLFQEPGSSDPFFELYFHYNLIKQPILCPRMNSDKECPCCNFAFNLKNVSDEAGKPFDKETFKKLMPKQRFYGLVLDREDTTNSPKWWGFGKEIYQQLVEALLSEDWSIFMDTNEGHDAEVSVVVKAGAKDSYSAPKLVFKKRQTKLLEDPVKLQEMLSSITPLSEVFKPMTKQEIQAALDEWMNLTEKDGEELIKGGSVKEPSEGAKEDASIKDLDAAFAKALED